MDAEAHAEADALIGDESMLVERFASRPELRAFSRRRPWLAFSVLPAFGLLIASGSLFAAIAGLPGLMHLKIPGPMVMISIATIEVLTLWVGPVAISEWCTFLAWRHRVAFRWPAVATVLVCATGTLVELKATYDASAPKPSGTLQFGLGFLPPTDQLVRGLVTFTVAWIPLAILARLAVTMRQREADG